MNEQTRSRDARDATEIVPLRIVVADDHSIVRAGLAAIINASPGMIVVGEAGDGDEAVEMSIARAADVALMDISMPGVDGLQGLARMRERAPSTAVVMLTTFNVEEHIARALRDGASGFLLKTAPAEEIIAAIGDAHRGERRLSQSVQDRLIDAYIGAASAPAPEPGPWLDLLTERETEVFRELVRGKSNAEIAQALFLSEATVKTYITRILSKLGLRDRVQAVLFAMQHGFVPRA